MITVCSKPNCVQYARVTRRPLTFPHQAGGATTQAVAVCNQKGGVGETAATVNHASLDVKLEDDGLALKDVLAA